MWPWREDSPDWLKVGVSPSHAASCGARAKRFQSPPSSRCSAKAVSVSMPWKLRSRATVGHYRSSSAKWESRSASAAFRALIASTHASASA